MVYFTLIEETPVPFTLAATLKAGDYFPLICKNKTDMLS